MDATIVIPTKNGGDLLDEVLQAVDEQDTKYEYEVICVDSGSTDQTIDIIKKHNCILKQIPKEEFGHGKTRNLGASLGTGEYIVFITQDAKPASDKWLDNFIDAMKIDDEIVGGFGIHYPYPDCNLLDKRDLYYHFKGFGEDNTIYYMEDKERYAREEGYRHLLSFFSDNNSCLKRSVWEKYPYDDVNFAEDQVWAKKMIELGYKKIYCPFAPVYHSHNFPLKTYKQRYFDEYKGLYQFQGYKMVNNVVELVLKYLKNMTIDVKYIKSLDLPKTEKKQWVKYTKIRDWYKFYAAYLAVKYFEKTKEEQEKMDKKLSQQYEQINK